MPDERSASTKTEIIQQLQISIEQLQSIVNTLQNESIERLPSSNAVNNLVNTTSRLAQSLSQDSSDFSLAEEEEITGLDRLSPSFNGLQGWWDGVIQAIRRVLPTDVNNKLSDWGLTSFLAGLIVIIMISSVLLLPNHPPEFPSEIAENLIKNNEIIEELTPEPIPPEAIATPPELIAPEPAQPIELEPPPEPVLSPEQSLIAAIQQEINDLTGQYPDSLVLAIEPNFLGSQLTVTLSTDWYQLSTQQQDGLANTIWQRSQKLAFRKLNLMSPTGSLIARNPVVGSQMIVIERQLPDLENTVS